MRIKALIKVYEESTKLCEETKPGVVIMARANKAVYG